MEEILVDSMSEEDVVLPFAEVTQMFVDQVTDTLHPSAEPQMEPRFLFSGYSGCNDAFSVFGFLAFLLALFDLIMELQNDSDMTRSIRDVSGRERLPSELFADQLLPVSGNQAAAAAACYSMLRGFLHGMTTTDAACAEKFVCEGADAAAATGPLGQVIAKVVSRNAGDWLARVRETQYKGVGEAGQAGARGESCDGKYLACLDYPSFYSHPSMYDAWADDY
ncbi:uncharacterized protein LOC123506977 isoform X2 [Portunus trituberculatus]|uniref:uncharacterized protein LOC123506977 isoform X2 n=1 Tax=Portunus trituberculatus TaxID=210409 RepID=UPI001E1CBD21|nr:uncharacterized protein LOC123506977 isoform X2 [Portunus trituberculatus]